jgi:hypothetical protein
MKKIIMMSALACAAISTAGFCSSMSSLSKSQVTSTMNDKTISSAPVITMDNELVSNTFTGYFGKDGKLNGQLANKPDNGPQTDTGTWKVNANGTLCATWDHWNSSKPICVSVYKVSNGYLLVNSQNQKFETLLLNNDMKSGNQLN